MLQENLIFLTVRHDPSSLDPSTAFKVTQVKFLRYDQIDSHCYPDGIRPEKGEKSMAGELRKADAGFATTLGNPKFWLVFKEEDEPMIWCTDMGHMFDLVNGDREPRKTLELLLGIGGPDWKEMVKRRSRISAVKCKKDWEPTMSRREFDRWIEIVSLDSLTDFLVDQFKERS